MSLQDQSGLLGYGKAVIEMQNPQIEPRMLTLNGVAYCPQMGTGLVSLHKMRQFVYWWDQRNHLDVIRRVDGQALCKLSQKFNQYVIESNIETMNRASFYAKHLRYNSWTSKKPSRAQALIWHRQLGARRKWIHDPTLHMMGCKGDEIAYFILSACEMNPDLS